jgi:hypothetical protein
MRSLYQYHATKTEAASIANIMEFPLEPSESSIQCTFLDTNPYMGKKVYVGRIKITCSIQKRSTHSDYVDTH